MSTKEEELKQRFLKQRTDKFTIVLNDNELNLFKSADYIKQRFCTEDKIGVIYIACIKHDNDFDDLNHRKTLHYHVVMQLDKICRIGTMINTLISMFHCNENQITIDKCSSICMQSRYLMHLDDYDKTRYFVSEVATNDTEVLQRYIDLVIVRDLHDLVAVVHNYHYDFEQIMLHVAHYDKWRKYINDLIINHNRKF